jgi:hypothetical protein
MGVIELTQAGSRESSLGAGSQQLVETLRFEPQQFRQLIFGIKGSNPRV